MRFVTILFVIMACRNTAVSSNDASAGAPAESASEFRGIATAAPKPQTDGDDHRRRPAVTNGKRTQCHMLDGTKVDACMEGDALCSCE